MKGQLKFRTFAIFLGVFLVILPSLVFAQGEDELYSFMDNLAFNYRDRALYLSSSHEEAIEICNEGIAYFAPIEAKYPEATSVLYDTRADIYISMGKYEDAILDCKKGIVLYPNYMGPRDTLARAYIGLGETDPRHYENALEVYATNIEIDPDNDFTFMKRAKLYILMSEYDKAMTDIDFALNLNDGYYWEMHYVKAQILLSQGMYARALDVANYALTLENFDEEPYLRPIVEEPLLLLKSQIESAMREHTVKKENGIAVDREDGKIRLEGAGLFAIRSIFPLRNGNLLLFASAPSEHRYGESTSKASLLCLGQDGAVLWEITFGEELGYSSILPLLEREDGSVLSVFEHSIAQKTQYTQLQSYSISDGTLLWTGTTVPEQEDTSENYHPVGVGYLQQSIQDLWSIKRTENYQMYNADGTLRWQLDRDDSLGELGTLESAFETPYGTMLLGRTRTAIDEDYQTRGALVSDTGQVVWKKKYPTAGNSLFLYGTVSPTGEIAVSGFADNENEARMYFLAVLDAQTGEMTRITEFESGDFRYGELTSTDHGWLIAGSNMADTGNDIRYIEMDANGNIINMWNTPFPNDTLCMITLFKWNSAIWANTSLIKDYGALRIELLEKIR